MIDNISKNGLHSVRSEIKSSPLMEGNRLLSIWFEQERLRILFELFRKMIDQ
jgi:hypothetical protein